MEFQEWYKGVCENANSSGYKSREIAAHIFYKELAGNLQTVHKQTADSVKVSVEKAVQAIKQNEKSARFGFELSNNTIQFIETAGTDKLKMVEMDLQENIEQHKKNMKKVGTIEAPAHDADETSKPQSESPLDNIIHFGDYEQSSKDFREASSRHMETSNLDNAWSEANGDVNIFRSVAYRMGYDDEEIEDFMLRKVKDGLARQDEISTREVSGDMKVGDKVRTPDGSVGVIIQKGLGHSYVKTQDGESNFADEDLEEATRETSGQKLSNNTADQTINDNIKGHKVVIYQYEDRYSEKPVFEVQVDGELVNDDLYDSLSEAKRAAKDFIDYKYETSTRETSGNWDMRYREGSPEKKRQLDGDAQDMFGKAFLDLDDDEQDKVVKWYGTSKMAFEKSVDVNQKVRVVSVNQNDPHKGEVGLVRSVNGTNVYVEFEDGTMEAYKDSDLEQASRIIMEVSDLNSLWQRSNENPSEFRKMAYEMKYGNQEIEEFVSKQSKGKSSVETSGTYEYKGRRVETSPDSEGDWNTKIDGKLQSDAFRSETEADVYAKGLIDSELAGRAGYELKAHDRETAYEIKQDSHGKYYAMFNGRPIYADSEEELRRMISDYIAGKVTASRQKSTRTYLQPGQSPPPTAEVQRDPEGKLYYETDQTYTSVPAGPSSVTGPGEGREMSKKSLDQIWSEHKESDRGEFWHYAEDEGYSDSEIKTWWKREIEESTRETSERIYLRPGEKPPKGAGIQRGPSGGLYYDSPGQSGPKSDVSGPGAPIGDHPAPQANPNQLKSDPNKLQGDPNALGPSKDTPAPQQQPSETPKSGQPSDKDYNNQHFVVSPEKLIDEDIVDFMDNRYDPSDTDRTDNPKLQYLSQIDNAWDNFTDMYPVAKQYPEYENMFKTKLKQEIMDQNRKDRKHGRGGLYDKM